MGRLVFVFIYFQIDGIHRCDNLQKANSLEHIWFIYEEMCLMCKKLRLAPGGQEDENGIPSFLSNAMSPPHPKSVTNALELLVDLGVMDPETNELTKLGEALSVPS